MNEIHRQQLALIKEAHHFLSGIPDKDFSQGQFYDQATDNFNLLALWWILSSRTPAQLAEFKSFDKAKWIRLTQPLWHAIDQLLGYVLHEEDLKFDSFQIIAGLHPLFKDPNPKTRGIACLEKILTLYDLEQLPLNKLGSSAPQLDGWTQVELDWFERNSKRTA